MSHPRSGQQHEVEIDHQSYRHGEKKLTKDILNHTESYTMNGAEVGKMVMDWTIMLLIVVAYCLSFYLVIGVETC